MHRSERCELRQSLLNVDLCRAGRKVRASIQFRRFLDNCIMGQRPGNDCRIVIEAAVASMQAVSVARPEVAQTNVST
eukprot:2504196-Rhodomonas_salina.2